METTQHPVVPAADEVERAILELMAEAQNRPLGDLLAERVKAGTGMPIDSLESVEILLGLEERFSVRLPDDDETCRAFRSLAELVKRVQQIAEQQSS
jgi:acyl carrier protein